MTGPIITARAEISWRGGAMERGNKRRYLLIIIIVIVSTVDTIIINTLVEPTSGFWPKILLPILIFVGVIGRIVNNKPCIFLGWLGIVAFIPIALLSSLPDPELATPRLHNRSELDFRYIAIIVSSILWIWLFIKLRANSDLGNEKT
jgi:hypothetical protein